MDIWFVQQVLGGSDEPRFLSPAAVHVCILADDGDIRLGGCELLLRLHHRLHLWPAECKLNLRLTQPFSVYQLGMAPCMCCISGRLCLYTASHKKRAALLSILERFSEFLHQ